MIDLYALTSPNVQKIFIMLEECGLPYNVKPVDVWAGEQFTPEFAKVNPLLKVPAIIDSDGPGGTPYTVIESGAILLYLAEKTGKFIPHDPVARYDTLQWLSGNRKRKTLPDRHIVSRCRYRPVRRCHCAHG